MEHLQIFSANKAGFCKTLYKHLAKGGLKTKRSSTIVIAVSPMQLILAFFFSYSYLYKDYPNN